MSLSGKVPRGQLPVLIDPIQLAERGAHLAGYLSRAAMPRLKQACPSGGAGDIEIDLSFARSGTEDMFTMQGSLHVSLVTKCQRCLEDMVLDLKAKPRLFFMRASEALDVSALEEDVIVVDKPLALSELIEDELLLAMPMVPTHELALCPARAYVKEVASFEAGTENQESNPFSLLQKLNRPKP